ncbi:MAG: glycosyltransferase family 39 protein, partial [Candidatus Krumholzibacteriia bacterium]
MRRDLLVLSGLLLVGAVARGLYLSEIVDAPDFRQPAVDAHTHDYWARGLATGDWSLPADLEDPRIPDTPFFRPPGYPYFLALVYRLTGGSYLAPRIVQMLLGLLSAALAFLIGQRWFGRAAGLVAGGGMALYWAFIYFEGELHAPS